MVKQNNFPNVPILARPDTIPHNKGNEWKAGILEELYPYIDSIVDDNPKLSECLPNSYKGKVYLFGHNTIKKKHTIPCPTWKDVGVHLL